jgi:hypothetical protein
VVVVDVADIGEVASGSVAWEASAEAAVVVSAAVAAVLAAVVLPEGGESA